MTSWKSASGALATRVGGPDSSPPAGARSRPVIGTERDRPGSPPPPG
jgi:hypothetical protein